MKNLLQLTAFLFLTNLVTAQDLKFTFNGFGAAMTIDSVKATNITTGASITIPGGDTIKLADIKTNIHYSYLNSSKIEVYPNPFNGKTLLKYTSDTNEEVNVFLINSIGQVIATNNDNIYPGTHEFQIKGGQSGIYILTVISGKGKLSKKLICLNNNHQTDKIEYRGGSESIPVIEKSYSEETGDVIHFEITSGDYTTIIADSPTESKSYDVEFIECKDADGDNYPIVQIGEQWWMAENLAYLPEVSPPDIESDSIPYHYVFSYNGNSVEEAKRTDYFQKYGALYNFTSAAQNCPEGWHLPSNSEWITLANYIQNDKEYINIYKTGKWEVIGKHLKSANGWSGIDGNGSDDYGFGGLPGGYYQYDNINPWKYPDGNGHWWADSLIVNQDNAIFWRLYGNSPDINISNHNKNRGLSVRCTKDEYNPLQVKTELATSLTAHSSVLNGIILHKGGDSIAQKGFYWSAIDTIPDENDNVILVFDGTDEMVTILENLSPFTTYYFRAFAKNSLELSIGEVKSFQTKKETFIDARDSIEYEMVKIGEQVWMAENLAWMPHINNPFEASTFQPRYYITGYTGNENLNLLKTNQNYQTYGILYNHEAAKSACPAGWKLPDDSDWEQLADFLSDSLKTSKTENEWFDIGKELKSRGTIEEGDGLWANSIIITPGSDRFGYNALPAGYFSSLTNDFAQINNGAYFWSWTSSSDSEVHSWKINTQNDDLSRFRESYAAYGFSVRCIKSSNPNESVIIETNQAKSFTQNSAVLSGSLTFDGNSPVTGRGFYWSATDTLPDANNNIIISTDTTDEFQAEINNLFPNTSYFFRAFVINELGTAIAKTKMVNTLGESGEFTDKRDSTVYPWIKIGDQVWMSKNLSFQCDTGCFIDEDNAVYTNYFGLYYTWNSALNACPNGWHLPKDEEWENLAKYISEDNGGLAKNEDNWEKIGNYFKYYDSGHSDPLLEWELSIKERETADLYEFAALPGGYKKVYFQAFGSAAAWWSATEVDSIYSKTRRVSAGDRFLGGQNGKNYALSIRCLKNDYVELPIVKTDTVNEISHNTAVLHGEIIYNGGDSIIQKGFYYSSLDTLPDSTSQIIIIPDSIAEFSIKVDSLQTNTNYYFTAFAGNSRGIGTGKVVTFKTTVEDGTVFGNFIDTRDQHIYKWTQIGNQFWMAENLAWLPEVHLVSYDSDLEPVYYIYDYMGTSVNEAQETENYVTYGALYNRFAALQSCPQGWMLPSGDDWNVLKQHLNNNIYSGGKLKETGTTHWENPNVDATNSTRFSALPGGQKSLSSFKDKGMKGNWWLSSLSNNSLYQFGRLINSHGRMSMLGGSSSETGNSVRCLLHQNFTLLPVRTDTAIEVSLSSALLNASFPISPDKLPNRVGFYIAVSDTLLVHDRNKRTATASSTGFELEVEELLPYKRYYYQAFVECDSVISTGVVKSFATNEAKGTFMDERDNTEYDWVKIGKQIWMAENLAWLPKVNEALEDEPYSTHFVYDYLGRNVDEVKNSENYRKYGVLYHHSSAVRSCPKGWKLPLNNDWEKLKEFIIDIKGDNYIALELKSINDWNTVPRGYDNFGFSALPGGFRIDEGVFTDIGSSAIWWTSDRSETNAYKALYRNVNLAYDDEFDDYGYSVRCIADPDFYESLLTDSDGDGVNDLDDNCPETPNANQNDTDEDGVGDMCDNTDNKCLPTGNDPISVMTKLFNEYRKNIGLEYLAVDDRLVNAAQLHADDMNNNNYYSHTSLDGKTFLQRIVAQGYNNPTGELLANGTHTEQQILNLWLSDESHKQIIESPENKHFGIGKAGNKWVITLGSDENGPYCSTLNSDNDRDGFTIADGDCNDSDSLIHPDAFEICGDNIDNDCDGIIDDGKFNEYHTNTLCLTALDIGILEGDVGCTPGPELKHRGSVWVKIHLEESGSPTKIEDLVFKAKLEVPDSIDYDLFLYSNCEALLVSSKNGSGTNEFISIRFGDVIADDDSRDLYLEIRHVNGSSCEEWNLTTSSDCEEMDEVFDYWLDLYPDDVMQIGYGPAYMYSEVFVKDKTDLLNEPWSEEMWVELGIESADNPEMETSWQKAEFYEKSGNNHIYIHTLRILRPGQFKAIARMTIDNGKTFIYGDLDGSQNGMSEDQKATINVLFY